MAKQSKMNVFVIVDGAARFSFPTVAKAKRFADRMMRSHQIEVELA